MYSLKNIKNNIVQRMKTRSLTVMIQIKSAFIPEKNSRKNSGKKNPENFFLKKFRKSEFLVKILITNAGLSIILV